ncbi:MAG: haloalkane dehalogenase [Terriglobia bacterium]
MPAKENISAAFPFKANYVQVHGSKMHYVDEGSGDPILFLHGNPTSSYLWRNIIPYLTFKARCLAPDLIGMGKSDKPALEYRFFDHVKYIEGFINKLELKNLTLVVHDWGSALGFHYAARHQDHIKAMAFMEAILLPAPGWEVFPENFTGIFQAFRTPEVGWDLIVNKNMFVERILPAAVVRGLTDEEMNHYREPFKQPESRKPLWRWPNEIPIAGEPADVVTAVAAYSDKLRQSEWPKLLFHASPGAILRAAMVEWCRANLKNLKTVDVGEGIHFLQEDHPHRIGAELASWYDSLG